MGDGGKWRSSASGVLRPGQQEHKPRGSDSTFHEGPPWGAALTQLPFFSSEGP
jgi:hypothetical protein